MARKGDGSIYRDGDSWVAQTYVYDPFQGKTRKRRRRAKTRDQARALLAEMRADPVRDLRTRRWQFGGWMTWWVDNALPHRQIADSTKNLYRRYLLRYAVPAAGGLWLDELTPSTAEQWIARVAQTPKTLPRRGDPVGTPLAPATVRQVYWAAVLAVDTAVRDSLLPGNPLRAVEQPRVVKATVPVTSSDHVTAVLAALDGDRLYPLVALVAYTGCLIGEATALRWDDVDMEQGRVTFRRGSLHGTTKNNRHRTVTLLPVVVEALQEWRKTQRRELLAAGRGRQRLVFTGRSGEWLRIEPQTRRLRRVLVSVGATDARPWHSLRHGLVHRLLTAGVPLAAVSAVVGHSGVAITADTYGHLDAALPVETLQKALSQDS